MKFLESQKKSGVNLKDVKLIEQLPCQKVESYQREKKALKLMTNVIKTDDTDRSSNTVNDKIETTNAIANLLMISAINSNQNIPSWSGIRSLLSETKIPLMQVGFLPFIPRPVTKYSTMYTAMKNFVSLNVQLKQKTLPVFNDEGVFRIILDIFLNNLDVFKDLLLC